jgi:polar amino acid transport system ATP-binding protein
MRSLASRGMTMLVVTHEMGFARDVANDVVFLDGGKVVETGAPEAFFGAPSTERAQKFLTRFNR